MTIDIEPLLQALASGHQEVSMEAVKILQRELRMDPELVEELAASGFARIEGAAGREHLLGCLIPYVEHRGTVRGLFLDVALDAEQADQVRSVAIRGLQVVAHESEVCDALMTVSGQVSGASLQALIDVAARFPRRPDVLGFLSRRLETDRATGDGSGLAARALRSLYPDVPDRPQAPLQLLASDQERADALGALERLREALRDVFDRLPADVAPVFEMRVFPALDDLEDALRTTVPTEGALARLTRQAAASSSKVLLGADIAVGLLADSGTAASNLATLVAEFTPIAARFVM